MPQKTWPPRYPLQWPIAVPRTSFDQRKAAQFGKNMSWDRILRDLADQLTKLCGESEFYIVSTNEPVRKDGLPYAQRGQSKDPGVAVYFTLDGELICLPCDRWLSTSQNLRAIVMHIDAMRGMERWGVGTAKQAFMGYKALTATAGEGEPWWEVIGVARDASVDVIKGAHRELVKMAHPDRGGSDSQMARINAARDRGLRERSA